MPFCLIQCKQPFCHTSELTRDSSEARVEKRKFCLGCKTLRTRSRRSVLGWLAEGQNESGKVNFDFPVLCLVGWYRGARRRKTHTHTQVALESYRQPPPYRWRCCSNVSGAHHTILPRKTAFGLRLNFTWVGLFLLLVGLWVHAAGSQRDHKQKLSNELYRAACSTALSWDWVNDLVETEQHYEHKFRLLSFAAIAIEDRRCRGRCH